MVQRLLKKMTLCAAATICLVGLSLASVGCEENNQGINQTKQCPGKSGKCSKGKKACKEGCKKACCTSGKKCAADCKKACCTSGKKCDADGKKTCGKKACGKKA